MTHTQQARYLKLRANLEKAHRDWARNTTKKEPQDEDKAVSAWLDANTRLDKFWATIAD